MNSDLDVFRKRLRILIANSNLGTYEFAYSLEIGYETLRKWLKGESSPITSNLIRLCKQYNVSADWLLGLKDSDDEQ